MSTVAAACEEGAGFPAEFYSCAVKGTARMGAFGRSYLQDRTSEPRPTEIIGVTESLRLSLISDQPGVVEFLGSPRVVISLHVGPPSQSTVAVVARDTAVPRFMATWKSSRPNLGGIWELKAPDTALVIGLNLRVLKRIVEESGSRS